MKKLSKLLGLAFGAVLLTGFANSVKPFLKANAEEITYTFADVANEKSWGNGVAQTNVSLGNFTFKVTGGGNNGKYYTSDSTWRFYGGGGLSISSDTVTITNVTSNPSQTFDVSNNIASISFSATVKFKSITINYTNGGAGGTSGSSTSSSSSSSSSSSKSSSSTNSSSSVDYSGVGQSNYANPNNYKKDTINFESVKAAYDASPETQNSSKIDGTYKYGIFNYSTSNSDIYMLAGINDTPSGKAPNRSLSLKKMSASTTSGVTSGMVAGNTDKSGICINSTNGYIKHVSISWFVTGNTQTGMGDGTRGLSVFKTNDVLTTPNYAFGKFTLGSPDGVINYKNDGATIENEFDVTGSFSSLFLCSTTDHTIYFKSIDIYYETVVEANSTCFWSEASGEDFTNAIRFEGYLSNSLRSDDVNAYGLEITYVEGSNSKISLTNSSQTKVSELFETLNDSNNPYICTEDGYVPTGSNFTASKNGFMTFGFIMYGIPMSNSTSYTFKYRVFVTMDCEEGSTRTLYSTARTAGFDAHGSFVQA